MYWLPPRRPWDPRCQAATLLTSSALLARDLASLSLLPHLGPLPIKLGYEKGIMVAPLPDGLPGYAHGPSYNSITLAPQQMFKGIDLLYG